MSMSLCEQSEPSRAREQKDVYIAGLEVISKFFATTILIPTVGSPTLPAGHRKTPRNRRRFELPRTKVRRTLQALTDRR